MSLKDISRLSIAELKALREKAGSKTREQRAPPSRVEPRPASVPLSYAQQRLWFLDQFGETGGAYKMPMVVRLRGGVDMNALQTALDRLVQRHEALRTAFDVRDGTPYQNILPPYAPTVTRVSAETLSEPEFWALLGRSVEQRFDLRAGRLLRAVLFGRGRDEHVLLVVVHHIAIDGWSLDVLAAEIGRSYSDVVRGGEARLAPLAIQYADYAIWQRQTFQGQLAARELAYWKGELDGAPEAMELTTDRPRPSTPTFAGDFYPVEIASDVFRRLTDLGHRHGATPFMVLLSAFQVLLARWTGQRDLVIGTPIAGRSHRELEPLIGFFVNTLALRGRLSPEQSFSDLLGRTRDVALRAYDHQEIPFERLVAELKPQRDLSRQPIFQVMFALENTPRTMSVWEGLEASLIRPAERSAHFDLTLFLRDEGGRFTGGFEYATDLFDRSTVERLSSHFSTLLRSIVEAPDCAIGKLAILPRAEQEALLALGRGREVETAERVIDFFERGADLFPDRVAVRGRNEITYRDLDTRSNRLAHVLRKLGVGPNVVVGLCASRSIDGLVALLAILKAGGAYLPLDPDYPQRRLEAMVAAARPHIVLSEERALDRLEAPDVEVIVLDRLGEDSAACSDARPDVISRGDDLVYVMCTSGSTGEPKAVAMPNAAIANMLDWQVRESGQAPLSTLQFTSLSFDVSVMELFSCWYCGGTLVMASEGEAPDLSMVADAIVERDVERLYLPFVALEGVSAILGAKMPDKMVLREINTAGEQLKISPAIRALHRAWPGARLTNQYGPTETHVATAHILKGPPEHWPDLPPIGRPIQNLKVYVLDEALSLAPMGVAGELYIAGVGLARGYLNRPDLTEERFLADPYGRPGTRMYRTGDRARWSSGGELEFLGRLDDQVKVRGYRVELGEVEALLLRHPSVSQAAVVLQSVRGELVAYCCGDIQAHQEEGIKAFLRDRLPPYMVPSTLVVLGALPLTPTGKIDRKKLAEVMGPTPANDHVEPVTAMEVAVCDVWKSVLGVERVGLNDNFFDLGGHSLLAARLVAALSAALGLDVSLRMLFLHPTVGRLLDAFFDEIQTALNAPPESVTP